MDRYTQLKKALHRAIAKAYKTGNKTVMKALDGMPSKEHTVKHIMADLEDPNDIPQVPHNHLPANSESVLNKDADPAQEHNKNLQNIQGQKEMQAKAQLGQMESTDSSKKIHMNEGQENGVSKLKKFMDTKMAKSSKSFDRASHKDIKGVHKPAFGNKGTSESGAFMTDLGNSKAVNDYAKEKHKQVLSDLKDMPKPDLPKSEDANPAVRVGRDVKEGKMAGHQFEHSLAGAKVRRGDVKGAKQVHQQKLKQLQNEKKPNLTKGQPCGKCEACMKAKQMQKRCWDGYKPVPGKKAYTKGSCTKK